MTCFYLVGDSSFSSVLESVLISGDVTWSLTGSGASFRSTLGQILTKQSLIMLDPLVLRHY